MQKITFSFNHFLIYILLFLSANAFSTETKTAEISINKTSIYPRMLENPVPQGIVDENSPWLHFRIPFKNEKQELFHRLYYFELSQDSTFSINVIESKPKRWSFFNPYKILAKGKWFWRFAYANDNAPQNKIWSDKVYSFVIRGNEREIVYPTPEQLIERVASTKGPHVVMLRDEIGKLLPESHPDVSKSMLADFEKMLTNVKPVKVVVDTTQYPKYLKGDQIKRYFTLQTLNQFTVLADRVRTLLNAYLLTGDKRYKDLGLSEFVELDREYHTTMMRYGKKKGYPDDFSLEQHIKTLNLVLDAFADDIPSDLKSKSIELLFKIKQDGYLNFYKQLEFSEHTVYKAHLWQMGVYTLLSSAVILSQYKEEAKIWLEYAYELWLYRNPAASRTDGGWHEGNSYFGANERQLTFTPLFLGKLMNFNYFNHPWYQNVAKYLTYSTPFGNPGLAFADGNGYVGNAQSSLIETLAYLYPKNEWNLWRMKTDELVNGKESRYKWAQESVWSLLSIWKYNAKPDYNNVNPPKDKAAVFSDVGFVAMHTNIADPTKNMMVNFSSSPYGQLNHSHPSQNAFNLAYGSEPLFWRTGHYATALDHTQQSFKHTRAHNSILADGQGQVCDISGYGWIPRFVTGENISYALGDASHAYYRDADDSVKNPGVKRFRRHIARLEPNFLIIYDELEAEKPISWTFRLNAIFNMTKLNENTISTSNKFAEATAYLFCNDKINSEVTNKFVAEPIDVQGKRKDGKDRYPNHWHCSITTDSKLKATRFLTIIEVTPNGTKKTFIPQMDKSKEMTSFLVGNYSVSAQLNPEKPSLLEIYEKNGKCALVTGQDASEIKLGKEVRKAQLKGSTLFVDKDNQGETVFKEVIDTLPDVLIYGNMY